MKQQYYFGIDQQSVGPLKEEEIRQKIRDHRITKDTPAWCPSMTEWAHVGDIPELVGEFGDQLTSSVIPPPLHGMGRVEAKTPPPSPLIGAETAGGGLNDQAYRFVMWAFRPILGRSNAIRDLVIKNPQKALPIAVVTIAWIVMCLLGTMLIFTKNAQVTSSSSGQQIQQPAGAAGVDWQQIYREGRAVQQYQQQLQDDSYRYRRDSQDRTDEAYRRATYDWYRNND